MNTLKKQVLWIFILFFATAILYILGFEKFIGFLPIIIANSVPVYLNMKRYGKLTIITISLTIVVQLIAIILQLNEVVGILCLLVNTALCISSQVKQKFQ